MTGEPEPKGICVIGRTDFGTGIGRVTVAALELLSRYYEVSFFPSRASGSPLGIDLRLDSGRRIPIVAKAEGFAAYVFTDVLWNGVADFNYLSLPDAGIRIAHLAYDSDELPAEWVRILNDRFDVALFSSNYLEGVARASGVRIPVATLAIGLDIESLVARRYSRPTSGFTRFGTVSAFHERKGLDVLVEAFLDRFQGRDDAELVIHSNLSLGDTYARVKSLVNKASDARVRVSSGHLSEADKNELIDSFDVYVSASSGEGFSIGPREALALGKPTVLSRIPAHEELGGIPGVFLVQESGKSPARYPEIDNRVFGSSSIISADSMGEAMELAASYLDRQGPRDASLRKARASESSYTALAPAYAELFDPEFGKEARLGQATFAGVPDTPIARLVRDSGSRYGKAFGAKRLVIPMQDAGFFSIFNVFMSHLVWSLREDRVTMVLPDWDAGRLLERSTKPMVSYCYSQPSDGNMWLSLFEPLYGLTAADMNDRDFLQLGSEVPEDYFNTKREPYLTYVNAFELYRAPWFARFRKQYNSAFNDHVRLRPELQGEIDAMVTNSLGGRFTVSVHVKHPSHAIEQPGQSIAGIDEYVKEVRNALALGGVSESSDDWRVFVATDQDRVVRDFETYFGSNVVRFDDVARVSVHAQQEYDSLDDREKLREGHQLQHLMSADMSRWSTRLAWEVWRDAEMMASSDVLIHAVSNVATAASYLGPSSRMVYCEPS